MAKRLRKVPDDLSFQKTYDKLRGYWWCKEYECERYPDLLIRTHGRAGTPEIVQYTVLTGADPHSFKSLKSAYTYLMSKPRRVNLGKNHQRRDADASRRRSSAARYVLSAAARRNRGRHRS